MGKGLQFLQNKYTHPTNVKQQQRKYAALQKEKQRKIKQKERQSQLQKEQDAYLMQQTLLTQRMDKAHSKKYETELKKYQLSFLYKEPPQFPGNKDNKSKKLEQQKQLIGLKNDENMTRMQKNMLENEIEKNMSIHERNVHRFNILKNAPITGDYVKNINVVHKPFAKQIKHVKCVKCGKWGHKMFDRECKFSGYNPLQINRNNNIKSSQNKNKNDPISNMKIKQTTETYMHSEDNVFKMQAIEYNDGTDFQLIQDVDHRIKSNKHGKRKKRKNSKRHKHRKHNRNRTKSRTASRSRSRSRHRTRT